MFQPWLVLTMIQCDQATTFLLSSQNLSFELRRRQRRKSMFTVSLELKWVVALTNWLIMECLQQFEGINFFLFSCKNKLQRAKFKTAVKLRYHHLLISSAGLCKKLSYVVNWIPSCLFGIEKHIVIQALSIQAWSFVNMSIVSSSFLYRNSVSGAPQLYFFQTRFQSEKILKCHCCILMCTT